MADAVRGLTYTPEFITAQEEAALLARINEQPWQSQLKRRVQHYGHVYDYASRALASQLGPLPDWLADLAARVANTAGSQPFDQVIVNEYTPGQGIGAHVDSPHAFGPVVATVSLGSNVVMDFANQRTTVPVDLARRSLACLSGPARSVWTHGIAARQSDRVPGPLGSLVRRARGTRVSLTFRTVVSRASPPALQTLSGALPAAPQPPAASAQPAAPPPSCAAGPAC